MALLPACITDHNVETAEAADRFVHQPLAKRLVAHVTGDRGSGPTLGLDQCNHLARIGLFLRKIVKRHICATHPRVAAGYQRFAPREPA